MYYDRFVDIRNLESIPSFKDRQAYFVAFFSLGILSPVVVSFPTFFGYCFTHVLPIVFLSMSGLTLWGTIHFFIKIIRLEKRFHVFKKVYMGPLLASGFLFLDLVFLLLPIWTAHPYVEGDRFGVRLNPFFYFFVYWPLLIGYILFSYYAYLKGFGLYARNKRRTGIE